MNIGKKAHLLVAQQVEGLLSIAPENKEVNTDVNVFFVPKSSDLLTAIKSQLPFSTCLNALKDFEADLCNHTFLYPVSDDEKTRALLIGLGESPEINEMSLRKAVDCAIKQLRQKVISEATFNLPNNLQSIPAIRTSQIIAQSAMLSNYQFDKYLTNKNEDAEDDKLKLKLPLRQMYLRAPNESKECIEEQVVVTQETIFARNLGNERADVMTPAFMEQIAMECLELPNVKVTVLQQSDLAKEGMNMFLAVGQAATCPPRLILMQYEGDPNSTKKIGLVGKGITFDTGGLNLKPTGSMETMHMDMCGSAAVFGAFRAAARLGLKVNIVCALGMAENAIGSKAVRPHTIVKAHNGLTVEISNTDAEGRLVLGDTLSYVQKVYKPKTLINVATLTGACVVALGEYAAGIFSNTKELARKIEDSGNECYERCWPLPIFPEHSAELKGHQSDSRSTGKARYGGASVAAAFLQQFVDKNVAWAHIDVAGPCMYSQDHPNFPKGATGFGVHVLYTYLKNHEQS
ncbi:unnamed protein product [Albugo candida]|uniref:Cytosol aminopeptidase domain-containing protein n=1 Tax=Albugo candida TaxID=65357 RepID=A0A024G923_9STRA|nr:unnamed protein product [Albugo candida]|eukprot:CCI43040.1 unnamed protein product [Albugo candida]